MTIEFSPVTGRYVTLPILGSRYRIFFSENGTGTPLFCQHGGGLHNHQWRHMLADPELTSRYRVIAPDAPRHGKSDPPLDLPWWEDEYRLTHEFYEAYVLAVCDALEIERPIFVGMGSSANLALDLAHDHPDRFGGVISIEGADHTPGFFLDWWQHPLTNAPHVCATGVWDQMAPQSPLDQRWATWFYYTQGTEAFRGDLYFYSEEHDLRGKLGDIDTARCPVVIMAAEYDYCTTPEDGARTAAQIPGAMFRALPGIGHFPMSENYPVFRPHLLDALSFLHEPPA